LLYWRKCFGHRLHDFILIYDGNKYDNRLKKEFEKRGYIGNYYIINIVTKSLDNEKISDYLSYYEDSKFDYFYGIACYLTIFVDLKNNKLFVSKIISPANFNSLYGGRVKRLLTKHFKMKLEESKIIEVVEN
jgi:hypothetical protein